MSSDICISYITVGVGYLCKYMSLRRSRGQVLITGFYPTKDFKKALTFKETADVLF